MPAFTCTRGSACSGKLDPKPPPIFMNAASKPACFVMATTRGVTEPASPKGYANAQISFPKVASRRERLSHNLVQAKSGGNSHKVGCVRVLAPNVIPAGAQRRNSDRESRQR